MESYDKNGKKMTEKHFPLNERKIWNCENGENIRSDVQGSYSGTDEDGNDPVQDADDL